jgi:hypothetical protein
MRWRTLPPAAICPTWFAPSSAKRAFALRNGTTEEQTTALALLRQALTLDAGAGVKKEIERLARVVKKPPQRRAQAVAMVPMVPMAAMVLKAAGDAGGDTAADGAGAGAGEAAASSDPAVVASATATKTTRKSTTRKPAARKTTAKKRASKNNRLAPRALAARAEICNALRLLFSVRSPPPIQETTR